MLNRSLIDESGMDLLENPTGVDRPLVPAIGGFAVLSSLVPGVEYKRALLAG
jgi:hypothetical protein